MTRTRSTGPAPAHHIQRGEGTIQNATVETESTETTPTKPTFELRVVTADDEAREIEGRRAAIQRAKAISRETSYPVRLTRHDGGVLMSFHDGELIKYKTQRRR